MKENEKAFFKIIYSAGEPDKKIAAIQKILDNDTLFNINCKTEKIKSTGLHIAVDKENHELVQFFLNRDEIEVDSKDEDGQTPLFVAVRNACRTRDETVYNRDYEMITRLLNSGANCEEKDNEGDTPLRYAEIMDQQKKVFLLLKSNRKKITPILSNDDTPQSSASSKNSFSVTQNASKKQGVLQSFYNYFSGSTASIPTRLSETTHLTKKNN